MSNRVNLTLDVTKTGIQNPLIKVRQGDGGFETLRTTVTSNGEPMDLQGWTITFMGTTAGNHKIVDGNVTLVEAPNGIFEYTPSKAWGMDIGEFKIAYFKFVKGDGSASSANFRVNVIEAVDLTQEEAKNYISIVDATIAESREHLENSLADVTASVAATSYAASSLAVNVSSVASSAVNEVNSAASNASSVASSAASNVSSAAKNALDKLNNLSIGGRNYILNSKFSTAVDVPVLQQSVDPSYYSNKQVTTSVYIKYDNVKTMVADDGQLKRVVFAVSFRDASGNMRYLDAQKVITTIGESFAGRVSQTIDLSGFNVVSMPTIAVFITNFTADYVEASNPKLEIGNVATDWTPAPEDVLNNELVTPYKYGAIGDGKADDTQAIQTMLNDWKNRSVSLSGDFRITSPLHINNSVQIELTGKLIVDASMDYAIVVRATSGISGGGVGEIDLNNLSGGILVTNNAVFTPVGFNIKDIASNKIGISVDKKTTDGDTYGYVHMHDITMHNTSYQDKSIGVYGGRDSFYNNLETINLEIGMKLYGWDNYINGFHPWNDIPDIVKKGVGLYLESTANDTHINNYYNDTMKYGFVLDADVSLTVTNMLSMWNTDFFNDSVNPGHPFVIYYSNEKISKPGRLVSISDSKFNQDPSQNGNGNLTPILSSISDNIISISGDLSQSHWWNLPMQVRPLVDGDDVNKYSGAGSHAVNGANNLVNYPSGASTYATLEVDKINQNTSTQTLTDTNNKVFIRNLGGNPPTWSSWTELAPTSSTSTVSNKGVTMTFTRFGNIVTVIGSGNYNGGNVNTFSKISDNVVPSGFLPNGLVLVNADWGPNIGQMGFDNSGAWLHRGPSNLSNSWVVIAGSWSV